MKRGGGPRCRPPRKRCRGGELVPQKGKVCVISGFLTCLNGAGVEGVCGTDLGLNPSREYRYRPSLEQEWTAFEDSPS